jgi:hypothetical protein
MPFGTGSTSDTVIAVARIASTAKVPILLLDGEGRSHR